jgi:hypothetical protein
LRKAFLDFYEAIGWVATGSFVYLNFPEFSKCLKFEIFSSESISKFSIFAASLALCHLEDSPHVSLFSLSKMRKWLVNQDKLTVNMLD